MYDEDPMESTEAAAESWAAENVDGDRFKCQCGKWAPLAGSSPSGPSPYAIPICRECAAQVGVDLDARRDGAMMQGEKDLCLTDVELRALGKGMGPTGRAAARLLDRWREVDPKIGLLGLKPSDKCKETHRVASCAMIISGRTAELRTAMIYWSIVSCQAHVSAIASGNKEDFDAEMVHVKAADEKIAVIDAMLEQKMDLLEKLLQPEPVDE